jgi:hypothetical protein
MSTSPNPNAASPGSPTASKSVADLIEEARRNPVRWLIPDVLLQGGTHIVHGKEESFKTMLSLQMLETLDRGGHFLMRPVEGGLRTGIAELEQKPRLFGHRLSNFFRSGTPAIAVLPDALRLAVLNGRTARERIAIVGDWAAKECLEVVAIDSAVKLFPPYCDLSKPEQASEVFNQLQRLPTLWLIAHDRKNEPGVLTASGNEEIVGSGRFAQDPDVVHQMVRPDRRAPRVQFHWGKVREGEKAAPLDLWFDRVDFRLYPLHPFLHLLRGSPKLEEELVAEAETRYGWKERRAREYIAALRQLKDGAAQQAVIETQQGHRKALSLMSEPVQSEPDEGGN